MLSFTPDSSRNTKFVVKKRKKTPSLLRWADLCFATYKDVLFSLERIGSFQDCFPAHRGAAFAQCGSCETERRVCAKLLVESGLLRAKLWLRWGRHTGWDFWRLGKEDRGCCQLWGNFGATELSKRNFMEFLLCGVQYESSPCHLMKSLVKIRFSLFNLSQC